MRPLLILAFATLTDCTAPTTASNDLARAQHADALGHAHMAMRLYRAAGHGGSLGAQTHLASAGSPRRTLAGRLLSGYPSASGKRPGCAPP